MSADRVNGSLLTNLNYGVSISEKQRAIMDLLVKLGAGRATGVVEIHLNQGAITSVFSKLKII